MRWLERLGLRARLATALVAMAVLSVGTATVLANLGLPARVNEAASARLDREASHLAAVAAAFYAEDGRWTDEHVLGLAHLARTSGVRAELSVNGRPLTPAMPTHALGPTATATAPITVDGRRVGLLRAQPTGQGLLTPGEEHLRHSLDRLHLLAAVLSVLAALAVAFVLAQGLAGPLRRIGRGAERLARGDLAARVPVGGGPELESVATALNRLAATLTHEEAARKEGLADLAHELRTPVNGLLGRIEAAQDEVLEPRANLAAMHAEAERLSRLLTDIARLGDAQQPGLLVEKVEVDLSRLAAAASDRWQSRFAEKGVGLELDGIYASVMGDAERLGQIVDNLLSNALRYTEPGGSVVVRVASHSDTTVLEVADTGIGISADDLPHLFKRFWRGEKSRSRATGGAGIGLAIVEQLVHAHDGSVEVLSEPGVGTTFRVLVPSASARPLVVPSFTSSPEELHSISTRSRDPAGNERS